MARDTKFQELLTEACLYVRKSISDQIDSGLYPERGMHPANSDFWICPQGLSAMTDAVRTCVNHFTFGQVGTEQGILVLPTDEEILAQWLRIRKNPVKYRSDEDERLT